MALPLWGFGWAGGLWALGAAVRTGRGALLLRVIPGSFGPDAACLMFLSILDFFFPSRSKGRMQRLKDQGRGG